MSWKVPYIDLGAQYRALKPQIDEAVQKVLASGRYIGGEEVEKFEDSMAKYLGVKHVVSCGNGYDALYLAMKVLGVSYRTVMVPRYSHLSADNAVNNNSARLVNEDEDFYVVVHMNGRFHRSAYEADIEDACQALGASYDGRKAGTVAPIGCFSLHPMKILGCAGDGGFMATNDGGLASNLRYLKNHGLGGVNSRLDNLQAAILNVKLPHLDNWILRRREIAAMYEVGLPEWVKKPPAPFEGPFYDVYSSYVIGGSPELLKHMRDKGIECFSHIKDDVVSLPIYQEMKDAHVAMVIAAVKSYG